MKLKLHSILVCIVVCILFSVPLKAQNLHWIPFRWEGQTIEGRYFEKSSITIPVKIDNLPYKFKMQFDLGAETTMVYGNSIKNYIAKYPQLKIKKENSMTVLINNMKCPVLKDVELMLGDVSFGKNNIAILENFGDEISLDSIKTKSEKWIGTLGTDIFNGKILIIDYPNKRICVTYELPKAYADASFMPYKLMGNRIKIPLNINGTQQDLLFDTGSSMFALLTTMERANQITGTAIVDSIKTSTWGDHYYVYGKTVNSPITFGNKKLQTATVFADRKNKFTDFYRQENIWGITGNAYFLNNVVIIDYKTNRFGVK